jgi:hypothetical protein
MEYTYSTRSPEIVGAGTCTPGKYVREGGVILRYDPGPPGCRTTAGGAPTGLPVSRSTCRRPSVRPVPQTDHDRTYCERDPSAHARLRHRHPRSGSLRLLSEIGAALAADPGPPVPPAPSGSGAAKLEICDAYARWLLTSSSGSLLLHTKRHSCIAREPLRALSRFRLYRLIK